MKKKILLEMIMNLEKRVEALESLNDDPNRRPYFVPPPAYTLRGKGLTQVLTKDWEVKDVIRD